MQEAVRRHCVVESSLSLSSIDPIRRKNYAEFLGYHALESLSVARDLGAALWTDDLTVAQFAKWEYNVERIWTQLAIRIAAHTKRTSEDAYHEVSAKLAALRYAQVVWVPETIIAAARVAHWDTKRWPFRECLALIETAILNVVERTRIVTQVLQLIRRSDCPELLQTPIMQACLNALNSTVAVRAMHRRLRLIFPIDVASELFVRLELEHWLANHLDR
jgi:hypothetical protein